MYEAFRLAVIRFFNKLFVKEPTVYSLNINHVPADKPVATLEILRDMKEKARAKL